MVDDEPQILRAMRINLRARDYEVDVAADGGTALRAAAARPPDLVVLDLGLPDMEGADVIRGLRGWTAVPIIVLSGRADSADKVAALDAGADDYVTKPFGVDELLARIRAVTRRMGATTDATPVVKVGAYTVDLSARTVDPPDGAGEVRLTPTEWHMLEVLARRPDQLVTQKQLLREVWGPAYTNETNYLRVHLANLRRKVERDPSRPRHLITEPGIGYRFVP